MRSLHSWSAWEYDREPARGLLPATPAPIVTRFVKSNRVIAVWIAFTLVLNAIATSSVGGRGDCATIARSLATFSAFQRTFTVGQSWTACTAAVERPRPFG